MNSNTELDLGEIDSPLLVFSGPCSNLEATEALLELARAEGFDSSQVICTGDLAAYGANPAETVRAVRDSGCHVLMGNCEESLGAQAENCGCGFEEGSSCDVLSVAWFRHAAGSLSLDQIQWMATLPRQIRFTMAGQRALVIHGSVTTINQFVFPATDATVKSAQIAHADADIVIGGHSGVPFTQVIDAGLWHNSGIVGIPANDGTPRVWFSTLTPGDDDIQIAHRSLDYNYSAAASSIRTLEQLPNDYADAIENGLWPSDDVMPAADRENRGKPISPHQMVWPQG